MTLNTKESTLTRVRTLTPADATRGVSVIVAAFAADPVGRWVYPDAAQYLIHFPPFVRAFAGQAFEDGTAFGTDEGLGAALWLGPGAHSDEETMARLLEESVSDTLKEEVYGFIEQMGEVHPTEPHWYLPLLGVDPAAQGRGTGSALLNHALAICDHEVMPAYLEATTLRNRSLYERHGFEVVGEIQHGSSPPMWPMLRAPRSAWPRGI